MSKKSLKKARKTFKFWFKVLLGTELMDDPKHRQEFLDALNILKIHKKQKTV